MKKKSFLCIILAILFLITTFIGMAEADQPEILEIVAGGDSSFALKSDGTVWAWGRNNWGRLGDGTTTNRFTPTQVQNLTGVTTISTNNDHSLALKSDGTVWAWGRNNYGQLGNGTTTDSTIPVQVQNLTNVITITSGYCYSLALKSDGTVWAWGYNQYGRLGDGTTTNRSTPIQVQNLTGVAAISAGGNHSLALKSNGTVWAWGYNVYGQIGDGTTADKSTPVQVRNLTGITAIVADASHSVALKSNGTVWTWGWNVVGQLGNSTVATNSSSPVQVQNLTGVTAISSSGSHTLALKSNGTVWAWGYNIYGQLGDGSTTNSPTPLQVQNLDDVIAISTSDYHSLALKSDGTVWAWGTNGYGQLGSSDGATRLAPVQVQGLTFEEPALDHIATASPVTLNEGASQQLTITAHYSDGSTQDVTSAASYSSNDTFIATVSSSGLITGVNAGNTDIIITYQDKTQNVSVTVNEVIPVLESITVTPDDTILSTNETQQLTVTVHNSDETTQNVTNTASYTSNNETIATVNSTGLITAYATGEATITVTYEDLITTVSVTVFEMDNEILPQGDIIILRVPQDLGPVTYNCAAGFTVTENGINVPVTKVEVKDGTEWPYSEIWLYLAHEVTMGNDVVVQYNADPNYPINPVQGETVEIPVTTQPTNNSTVPLTIERSTVVVDESGEVVYVHLPTGVRTIHYNNGAGYVIRYGNNTVVPISRIVVSDDDPTVVRIYPEYAIPAGETVVVDYTPDINYPIETISGTPLTGTSNPVTIINESTAPIVVYNPPVVSGDGRTISIIPGTNMRDAFYEGNAGFRVFNGDQEIPILSVEVVDNKIILTLGLPLIAGQNPVIDYTPDDQYPIETENGTPLDDMDGVNGDNQSSITISSLEVIPSPVILNESESRQLIITAHYSDFTLAEVTGLAEYATDNSGIATVGNSGLATGIAAGVTNATVAYEDIEESVQIIVNSVQPSVLESITVSPTSITMDEGASQQLTVTAYYSDGSTQNITGAANYVSGNNAIATVSSSGLITGLNAGNTNITVTYQDKTKNVPVTVNEAAPTLEYITITPTSVTLNEGASQQLTVTAHYSDGSTSNVTGESDYTTTNSDIASVSTNGLVEGLSAGNTLIMVSFEGKTQTVSVTVNTPVVVVEISVQPETVTLLKGSCVSLKVIEKLSDGTTRTVTQNSSFSSNNTSIATVNSAGLVTGISQGVTKVIVTYQGNIIEVPVTVTQPTVNIPSRGDSTPPVVNPPGDRNSGNPDTVNPPNDRDSGNSNTVNPPSDRDGDNPDAVNPRSDRDSSNPGTVNPPGDRDGDSNTVNPPDDRPDNDSIPVNQKTR